MRFTYRFASLAALAATLAVVPGSAQKTTGPKATYAMDVSTMSGMGMGAMMGGGLGSLFGGGGGDNYMLELRLTSATPSPTQPEKGDHFFLPIAKMGKSVPLIGDAPGEAKPDREYDPNQTMEKPKGRILMFWGCHANAPKGQPFIIDFAKIFKVGRAQGVELYIVEQDQTPGSPFDSLKISIDYLKRLEY